MDRKLIRKRDREPARNMDRAALADEDLERVTGGKRGTGYGAVCPKCGKLFSANIDLDEIMQHIDSCSGSQSEYPSITLPHF